MKSHRTNPNQRRNPSTTAVTVMAVVAFEVVLAIGAYVVVNRDEVVGFAGYLSLVYGDGASDMESHQDRVREKGRRPQ